MKRQVASLLVCSVLAAAVGSAWARVPVADGVVRFEIRRFEVTGNTLLSPAQVEAAVAPYTGAARDFGDVQRALEALEALYHARGYNLVTVRLPEQELKGGVVRLAVVQTRIGRVTVSGNRAFSEANILRSIPALQPGRTPQLAQVSANLKLANENPAKKIKLSLEGGQADDEVDARIAVADERPWRAMLNLDNSGTDATGKTHAGIVLQHANLLGRDHVGSMQYTTTLEKPDQVSVWAAGYHIPLYALGDSVDLFASYSNVDSGSVNAGLFNLQVSGKGAVYGARYNSILVRRAELAQRLVFGLEHKAYKNSVMFAGYNFGNDVTVHPLSAAWIGSLALPKGEANLALTMVHNIAGGSRGGSADFARARSSAKADWNALRIAGAYSHAIGGDWQARLLVNGQYTRDALVPGEQFGAGGSTSVRGFEERELATDTGLLANLELYTPDLCGNALWQCRALAFYDIAWGERNHALPGELTRTTIASAGIGLRLAAGSAASVQLDYGHTARTGALAGIANNKLHVRVGLAY